MFHKSGFLSNHHRLAVDPSILALDPENARCSISNAPPTTMLIVSLPPSHGVHNTKFPHLNLVSDYWGVKAKSEGVFNWFIRKKQKKINKNILIQYFYDLEDKVDSKRDGMLRVVIIR
jgi:hypothetical protein